MENLTGGTPPVRYLPCVVPCKLYFTSLLITKSGRAHHGKEAAFFLTAATKQVSVYRKYTGHILSCTATNQGTDTMPIIYFDIRRPAAGQQIRPCRHNIITHTGMIQRQYIPRITHSPDMTCRIDDRFDEIAVTARHGSLADTMRINIIKKQRYVCPVYPV